MHNAASKKSHEITVYENNTFKVLIKLIVYELSRFFVKHCNNSYERNKGGGELIADRKPGNMYHVYSRLYIYIKNVAYYGFNNI